jgi:predicted nucleic acid-binding protein
MFKKLGKHKLSFVDVSLVVLARELGAKIITFDERLQKALAEA